MRRASWASTRRRSSSRQSSTARWMAPDVISWNTMRLTGRRAGGESTSSRCQAIDSPSRSSSVASRSSLASFSSRLSLATCERFSLLTTYRGLKSCSMSTPRRAHASPLCDAGTSAALRGRSRTCPIDDSTTKSPPRKREIVRALAGDSTITSGLAMGIEVWQARRAMSNSAPGQGAPFDRSQPSTIGAVSAAWRALGRCASLLQAQLTSSSPRTPWPARRLQMRGWP